MNEFENLMAIPVKADHLDQLNNLIKGVTETNQPRNILDWARKMGKHYSDALVEADIQPYLFQGAYPVQAISYTDMGEDEEHPCIWNYEPDHVVFQIRFDDEYHKTGINPKDTLHELFILIVAMVLSDCTGCCNALDFINLSAYGVLCSGDVSRTYHS